MWGLLYTPTLNDTINLHATKAQLMKKFCFWIIIFTTAVQTLAAQDSTLVIGVKEAQPFVGINSRGEPVGLSIDFWQLVQRDAGVAYSYKVYSDLEEMLSAVASGEVDLSVNPITVTDHRMQTLDFSQPFYISGTAIVRKQQNNWLGVLKNVFSWQFFSAVAALLFVIFIFGVLVWYFERKQNQEQFGKGAKGIGDGFWWSAVTMTTVGYGDKAPITRGGRVVGFIWMFAAIILISSLTAGIASSLTVQSLEAKIHSAEDLRRFGTGTIQGSSSANYLDLFDVDARQFTSVEEGLEAVANGDLDVFVYDRPILQFYLNHSHFDKLVLSPKNLKTDYYSFSFKKGSPLRDYLDPFVVKALKSDQWSYKLKTLEREE